MITRRQLIIASGSALLFSALRTSKADAASSMTINPELRAIEQRTGGRLGVALMDGEGSLIAANRADERFAMCSTFKASLAGAMMVAHDAGKLDRFAEVAVGEKDLVSYAPFTEELVKSGSTTTLDALAKNAVQISDNSAANIVMRAVGGPAAMTEFFRAHGGNDTRLDRWETELNENAVGDPRDTTTPRSMANHLRQILIGQTVGKANATTLGEWMIGSKTGDNRIRAGVPERWTVGDKTGTSSPPAATYNDVAIIWPGHGDYKGSPFLLVVYLDRPKVDAKAADAALADVARVAVKLMGLPD